MAYELLTGALPFDVTVPPFRQMQSKISGDLIDPLDANPMLSVATCTALLQGLHVERKERPKTAVEFCQILVTTEKSEHIKPKKGLKGFWRSLQPTSKVTIITALIAAVAGFLTTVIKIIPDLLKFMRR